MENREKIEDEEYKKRMKELVEKVEKNKDKDVPMGEQQIIDAKKRIMQTAKSKLHPDFRNEMALMIFTFQLKDYLKERAESTEKDLLQKEIDDISQLIINELKKPSAYNINYKTNRIDNREIYDKRRILGKMGMVLGRDHMNAFYEKYKINKLRDENLSTNRFFYLIVIIGICLFPILLVLWYLFRLTK